MEIKYWRITVIEPEKIVAILKISSAIFHDLPSDYLRWLTNCLMLSQYGDTCLCLHQVDNKQHEISTFCKFIIQQNIEREKRVHLYLTVSPFCIIYCYAALQSLSQFLWCTFRGHDHFWGSGLLARGRIFFSISEVLFFSVLEVIKKYFFSSSAFLPYQNKLLGLVIGQLEM